MPSTQRGALLAVLGIDQVATGPAGRVGDDDGPVRHVERIPGRTGRTAAWPQWTPAAVRAGFGRRGVEAPWEHQAAAAELARRGEHVVVATGPASGKSLTYQLAGLTALLADPRACVLQLSPTKALAADQFRALVDLAPGSIRPATFDGDTALDERDWVRDHSRWVLTNPDMLHRSLLPRHDRWARLFRRLAMVVVDECHIYRGVFGSHVALVLRRLRRLARLYGSDPVFVLASATVADPARSATALIGAPVTAVIDDASPRPGTDFVLWEPTVIPGLSGENGAPVRRSAAHEAGRMLADLSLAGARTLAFVRSRQGAERVALQAAESAGRVDPEVASRIAAYRGGYLPEERRELERALDVGELVGVATTNALELGVDIAGLDAAVLAGYPGSLASLWQQAGRAGRGGADGPAATVVLVAGHDPLDSYLVRHPEAVFSRPVEASVTQPHNPHILGPHLICAAAEHRLDESDLDLFGGEAARTLLTALSADRTLRRRPTGWYHVGEGRPGSAVDLRGGGGPPVAIVEEDSGRLLGTVDSGRAPATVHRGAVHLHRGDSYVVDELDLDNGIAWVHAERPEWSTAARSVSTVELVDLALHTIADLPGGVRVGVGPVDVTEQVVGYLRRLPGGEVLDVVPLDLPEQRLCTRGVWYSIEPATLAGAGVTPTHVPGALHAAEHSAIGLLPLFAGCDRRDIGGLSTALHPDTGLPTVIVYDGYPGGAGFADRGFEIAGTWLGAVRELVRDCGCPEGCPSCVQSPKCGNGNQPLDKVAAVHVLDVVVTALDG